MTPSDLADAAVQIAGANGLGLTVWDEDDIARERLGGLHGVSLGSDQPPRFIKLVYEPFGTPAANGSRRGRGRNGTPTLALVGKGITFDSGGLSLKTPEGMITMKTDMSGAAAVLAVMSVIGRLAPKVRVVGYCCATENLPGPKAIKPGDILRIRNGKTIEVLNTDAEGRLVLADGLSMAVEDGADAIVDLATLTGAAVTALGREIAAYFANDDSLGEQVKAASERAGEPVWRLPLAAQYRKHIDSEIADIKNTGAPGGQAGSIAGALVLKEFVADTPWVHLDIAGPARSEVDDGIYAKGGTGFGVRTLVELVSSYGAPAAR
jgi:leucyl aminopeptidase